jgi:hypothetical protein
MVERVASVAKRKSRPFAYSYKPKPGRTELGLWKACNFKRKDSESRQDELFRLMAAIVSDDGVKIGKEANGWINAALDHYNDDVDIPEPDKFEWLSPLMQDITGMYTMKRFMKMDIVESKRERRLLKVR